MRASLSALASVARSYQAARSDGWANAITGIGLPDFDRSKGMRFDGESALPPEMLTNLYRSDDIVRKIVGYFPEETFRRGVQCCGPNAKQLAYTFKRFGLVDKIQAAAIWGRLYGGACLAIATDGESHTPLRYRKGLPISQFRVFDKRELQPLPYHDPANPTQRSQANWFRVSPINETPFILHRSRAIWFGGIRTDRQTKEGELNGWDDSALQPVINAIASFNGVDGSIDNMVSDASQGVFKMHGLLNLIEMDPEKAELRARFMDLTRSICKALFLDAESGEEFTKIATSFASLPEIWDRRAIRVASAAGFPVTVLFGISPAGLNATGESDLRNFDNRLLTYGQTEIEPGLSLLNWLLSPDNETRAVLPARHVPTAKEDAELEKIKADTKKVKADTYAVYLNAEVLLPEQVSARLEAEGEIEPYTPPKYTPTRGELPATTPEKNVPKIEVTPSDVVTVVTVNQLLASMGLPPRTEAEGGSLTVSQYQAKNAAAIAAGAAAVEGVTAAPAPSPSPVVP